MIFVSFEFAGFLAVVVAVYYLLPLAWRPHWLLVSSLYFCGRSSPAFLLQCLAATGLTYLAGLRIERETGRARKQRVLFAAIAILVGNLLVFKYTSFFNETFRGVFSWFGLPYPVPHVALPLPLGISFYTFLLVGYLIDIFRGAKAETKLTVFALFSTFFPKFVAGPIERARNLLPQLNAQQTFNAVQFAFGLQLILWGLFKKVVVADRLYPVVREVYSDVRAWDGVVMTIATTLYSFRIYADFSGYTDMALGVAALFGYTLVNNFRQPYFATSIQDFWKRWHISLTSWLTDYVFTPISRQRSFKVKFFTMVLIATFLTFMVSGLWHGAQWTFVAWGALHGAYIVIYLWLQKPWNDVARRIGLIKRPILYRILKGLVTFVLVWLAYVLFRSQSFSDALYVYTHLGTGWDHAWESVKQYAGARFAELSLAMAGVAVMFTADFLRERGFDARKFAALRPTALRWGLYYAGATSVLVLGAFYASGVDFIYFRF